MTDDTERLIRRDGLAAFDRRELIAFAVRLLGSVHDAEDVVQEAIARSLDRLPPDTSDVELAPWLYRVVRNACLDELRHRRRTAGAIERLARTGGSAEDAHAVAARREQLTAVVDDLRRLPARQRDAVLLACVDGLSHAELAERLQSTVPATKSLLSRARSNLARMAAARERVAERSRRAVGALLAPLGKLLAVAGGGAAPAAVLGVAAIGVPVVLTGGGKIVDQHTVAASEPAPRPLEYGPFRIDRGAPLPAGVRLEEATVELPAGETAPRWRQLAITCPPGFVQAGISTGRQRVLARHTLALRSRGRMGHGRRGVILFRPRRDLPRPLTVRLGLKCATREYWLTVGKPYGSWAECQALSRGIRNMRRNGETVPRGLVRAQEMDCRAARNEIQRSLERSRSRVAGAHDVLPRR